MTKSIRITTLMLLTGLLMAAPLSAQKKTEKPGNLGRIIGTAAGAAGGIWLGWTISDDDAPFAERKIYRNMAISSAALATAGYFLGRAVDRSVWQRPIDPAVRTQVQEKIIQDELRRLEKEGDARQAPRGSGDRRQR